MKIEYLKGFLKGKVIERDEKLAKHLIKQKVAKEILVKEEKGAVETKELKVKAKTKKK